MISHIDVNYFETICIISPNLMEDNDN